MTCLVQISKLCGNNGHCRDKIFKRLYPSLFYCSRCIENITEYVSVFTLVHFFYHLFLCAKQMEFCMIAREWKIVFILTRRNFFAFLYKRIIFPRGLEEREMTLIHKSISFSNNIGNIKRYMCITHKYIYIYMRTQTQIYVNVINEWTELSRVRCYVFSLPCLPPWTRWKEVRGEGKGEGDKVKYAWECNLTVRGNGI